MCFIIQLPDNFEKMPICLKQIYNIISEAYCRRKIRLIEVNAKCCHLKKLTCKGTFRHLFIRVYRREIADFLRRFSHVGIFNPAL